MTTPLPSPTKLFGRDHWLGGPIYNWWHNNVVETVDHAHVIKKIFSDNGWSPRYLFLTLMSAGIAVLGLLLSSPAVVIGAMLLSPLMTPIIGLGFSLALFDYKEMRESLISLAAGAGAAILFTALIVLMSPLQAPTTEIIARTRPNLFDLGVAMFAALAGAFAVIRGRGETIVGVAIATALMPPLAVVGYGLATWNAPVLGGAFALFLTNLFTIALSATVMARFYGFGFTLSSQQSWTQTGLLLGVFIIMAVPLGISLKQIAGEALTVREVRSVLTSRYGGTSRVTQLDVDFDSEPITVRSVVITPADQVQKIADVQGELSRRLGQPINLQMDQVVLQAGASALAAQREEMRQATELANQQNMAVNTLAHTVALAAGVDADEVTIDRERRRATANAAPLPGARLATYHALEQRVATDNSGWNINIIPPRLSMPTITFEDDEDTVTGPTKDNVLLSIWAAKRWNTPALSVPGLVETPPENPNIAQRRALAIAMMLRQEGISPVPARAQGSSFRLTQPVQSAE
ncbi:MAG: DUF389 domain-containing protein [Sphingobium sp.]|nr:DUF389 domain-containing protein [Sphingobium sp.]MCP5398567.1 DUF389 domain-containing protein [Sphingomonas sp.]